MTTNFGEVLTSFVKRIETLEAHISERRADIKEIYGEAKKGGLNVKAIRKLIAERRQDQAAREAMEETLDQYRHALGMLATTPLGEAAIKRAGE